MCFLKYPTRGRSITYHLSQSLTHIVKQHFTVCLCQQSVVSGYSVHGANWRAEIKKHINQIPIQDTFFHVLFILQLLAKERLVAINRKRLFPILLHLYLI